MKTIQGLIFDFFRKGFTEFRQKFIKIGYKIGRLICHPSDKQSRYITVYMPLIAFQT